MLREAKYTALMLATSVYLCCICLPSTGAQSDSIRLERSSASRSDYGRGEPIAKAVPLRMLSRILKAVANFAFSPVLPEKDRARLELESGPPVYEPDSERTHLVFAYSSISDRAPPLIS
jgi:hypothetical protein